MDAVFMPCGHAGMCYTCAMEMWKSSNACHLCREAIKSVYQLQKKGVGKSKYYQVVASTKRVKVAKGTEEKDIEFPPDMQSQISMSVMSSPPQNEGIPQSLDNPDHQPGSQDQPAERANPPEPQLALQGLQIEDEPDSDLNSDPQNDHP